MVILMTIFVLSILMNS